MANMNFFGGSGYLSDQQRLQPLERIMKHGTIHTCMDLSIGIIYVPFGSSGEVTLSDYSNDLSSFMCFWTKFIFPDLNGFTGFNHFKYRIHEGKVIEDVR